MGENQKHCYIKNCRVEPEIVCDCEKEPILICKSHGIDHSKHKFDKIPIEIHEETRKAALIQFCKLKSDVILCKSKIIQEELSLVSEIRKVTKKALRDLKMQEQKFNEYISKILSLKEIDNSKEPSFIESLLKYSPSDFPKIQFINSLELHINHISSDDIQQLFELDEFSERDILDESLYEMKYIWSCSSYDLNIFNPITSKEDKIRLPTDLYLTQYGAKCLLPDRSLFYDNVQLTIIIDPKYHIKTLPKYSQQSANACAVYKDREIYLFGGAYTHSVKFTLSKNRWTRLINMPISLGIYTFGAVFKNYILLASMSSDKIIYYDTEIDSYSQILSVNSSISTAKAFFVENETVYFIEFSKYIYRSADHLTTWDNIGSSWVLEGNAPIISTLVTYHKKIYFANYFGIYSFDLRHKKIKKIKKLSDY